MSDEVDQVPRQLLYPPVARSWYPLKIIGSRVTDAHEIWNIAEVPPKAELEWVVRHMVDLANREVEACLERDRQSPDQKPRTVWSVTEYRAHYDGGARLLGLYATRESALIAAMGEVMRLDDYAPCNIWERCESDHNAWRGYERDIVVHEEEVEP